MASPKLTKKAYENGKKAYLEGLPDTPPKELEGKSDERRYWFQGYYETRCIEKHQATFKKYGITYP
jgi:hypothetical protein